MGDQSFEISMIPSSELQFSFVRSSGPGGQNVNKVNSKAELRWNFAGSIVLDWAARARFRELFGNRITKSGDVIVVSDRFRDRTMNQSDCLEKLREMILAAREPPKTRKKTKRSKAASQKIKDSKKRQGAKKKLRAKGNSWDY